MEYGVKSHKAVIIVFIVIMVFAFTRQWIYGWNIMQAMDDIMAGFFLIFGFFKIIDLHGFVLAYRRYNLLAQQFALYGYILPFIEISIGFAYLLGVFPLLSNIINLIIMSVGFVSVFIKLIQKEVIPCACLGTLFSHPLSLMSLFENVLMVVMAFYMLMYHW